MRYLILSFLLFSGCQNVPLPAFPSTTPPKAELFPISESYYDKYFQGKLKGQSKNFITSAAKHDVDVRILIGICMWESGNGKSRIARKYNNVSGSMGKRGPMKFSSVKESIEYTAANLRQNYLNKKRKTLSRIGAKYAPKTNGWVAGVKSMIKILK